MVENIRRDKEINKKDIQENTNNPLKDHLQRVMIMSNKYVKLLNFFFSCQRIHLLVMTAAKLTSVVANNCNALLKFFH